jgi:hypothetical protein
MCTRASVRRPTTFSTLLPHIPANQWDQPRKLDPQTFLFVPFFRSSAPESLLSSLCQLGIGGLRMTSKSKTLLRDLLARVQGHSYTSTTTNTLRDVDYSRVRSVQETRYIHSNGSYLHAQKLMTRSTLFTWPVRRVNLTADRNSRNLSLHAT